MINAVLADLTTALADFYATRPTGTADALFTPIVAALAAAQSDVGAVAPPLHRPEPPPVTRWLDDLAPVEEPHARCVADAFVALARDLPWTQTQAYLDAMAPSTADDYGYVKVLGPGSLLDATDVAIGIGVWAPGLHYPMHHHAAEEAYHVLAGRPEFRSADGEWRSLAPGEAFHQPAWAPHVQRFNDEPCLLMWAWGGSVTDPVVLVDA